jgi:septal ring factor EnvC (AmiA/AmiB activator)
MTSAWTIAIVPALLFSAVAAAQDVRGLEVCTAEKDMTRRTSCLQANVEFLQQALTKETRRAQKQVDDARAATAREVAALKADIAALKVSLTKAQDEIAAMKNPAGKK